MKKYIIIFALLLPALALFCGGCQEESSSVPTPAPPVSEADHQTAERLAAAQLGLLDELVSSKERERVVSLLERLVPLSQEREAAGRWEKSSEEERLIQQLNRLYERYTIKYIGSVAGGWGYANPAEYVLAEYTIHDGGTLRRDSRGESKESALYTEEDYFFLWDWMCSFMPDGAWDDFSRLIIFSDGEDEVLAYVVPADDTGDKWQIAVDPADAGDAGWFTETVLHEYAHYLTLNSRQVTYTYNQTVTTYNEEGLVANPGSYLDDFYQAFWADYLDDRLVNMDSYLFFFRHEDDFVTDYASTDPAEDIAESFTYFVLCDPPEGDAVWEQKLNFFYRYPELVQFRAETLERLSHHKVTE